MRGLFWGYCPLERLVKTCREFVRLKFDGKGNGSFKYNVEFNLV